MVRYVALLDANGKTIASSDAAGSALPLQLPPGFLASVLEQPVSTLMISPPVVSFATAERVLYFARHLRMADSSLWWPLPNCRWRRSARCWSRVWTSQACK